MGQYRRNYVHGGTFFFTVVTYLRQPILNERTISLLQEGFKSCISRKIFSVEAMVILPDHLHCIWQLPLDDNDYSSRWKFIKAFFTKGYFLLTGENGIGGFHFIPPTLRDLTKCRSGRALPQPIDNFDASCRVGEACRVGGAIAQPTIQKPTNTKPTASMQKKGEKGIWQRRFWEHTIRDERDYRNHCDYIHYNPVKHGLVKYPRDWPHSSFHEFVEKGLYPESWSGSVNAFPDEVGGE
ncbi:MAG: transposase [Deltaproteobacteria bacterium]|nr:transposase [Deltaproteobacteria bacterium]